MTKKVPLCNCIQFHTDDDAICAVKRSWLRDFAHDFITRCHDNGIGVVNLAPIPGINTNNLLDFRQFTVAEHFTFISRFDLTISIDSCCSHIAGALGIPNIVILGKALSASSQRPMSMNICLNSKTADFLYEFTLNLLRKPYKTEGKLKKSIALLLDRMYC